MFTSRQKKYNAFSIVEYLIAMLLFSSTFLLCEKHFFQIDTLNIAAMSFFQTMTLNDSFLKSNFSNFFHENVLLYPNETLSVNVSNDSLRLMIFSKLPRHADLINRVTFSSFNVA